MPPPKVYLLSRNGELKPSIALREMKDLLLFLRSAKCLIYPEKFIVAFQICFSKNLYLCDQ